MKFSRKLTPFLFVLVLSMVLAACDTGGTATNKTSSPVAAVNTPVAAANTPVTKPADTPTTAAATGDAQVTPSPTPDMVDSNPNAKTTIKLWIMPNTGKAKEDMVKVLEGFKKAMPDVNVQVTVLDWGSAFTKITTAITSGEGPDVTQLGTTWVGAMSAMDGLRPYTAEEIAAVGGQEAFFPAAWNTAHEFGKTDITAMPWFIDVRALYYRSDILKQLNLDPATSLDTWANFDATMKKITDAKIITTTYAFPGKNDWNVVHNFAPWIWGAGGEMLSADNSKSTFNSPEAVAGAKEYTSFVIKGYTPKSILEKNSADVDNIFKNGEAAFIVSGSNLAGASRLTTADGGWSDLPTAKNYGVVPIPAGPKGSLTFVGGSNLAVMKSTKYPKEAVALVSYLVGQQGEVDYAKISGFLPASKAGYNDPFFANDPIYQVFIKAAGTGKSYPTIAAWGAIEEATKKNLSGLWDDVAGVNGTFREDMLQKRLDSAAKEVDAAIAANK